jgi:hypothetical protein
MSLLFGTDRILLGPRPGLTSCRVTSRYARDRYLQPR